MMMTPNDRPVDPPRTEEVHLQDYLNVLYRRKRPAAIALAAVVLLVGLYTFISRPIYEASATLHVQDEKVKGGDLLGDLGLSRENPVETEVEILKSRTNAEEVVRRLQLNWERRDADDQTRFDILEFTSEDDEPEYRITLTGNGRFTIRGSSWDAAKEGESGKLFKHAGLRLLLDNLEGSAGSRFSLLLRPFNAVVQDLRDGTSASEVGKGTNIIRLAYRANDPQLASSVVNTLATVYLDRNVLLKSEEARKSVEFIEQQLDEVRRLLDAAEQSLQDYKKQSGVIKLDSEVQTLIERLSFADRERSAVRLLSRQAEFAITALEKALKEHRSYAPSSLLDDPVLAELGMELARLEVERKGLLGELTEAHPAVRTLDDKIAGAQRRMLESYQGLKRGFDLRDRDLGKEIDRFEAKLKELPAAEQQLARLTRLATVNADIYTFLLQKHEEARIARAATISSIKVIDPAIVPETPVKPNKKRNMLLALVVGMMAGIGLAFFIEYLDDTIKDAESAKQLLGAAVLAVIPHITLPVVDEGDAQAKTKRTLVTHLEPRSAASEAFRTLRTSVHFASLSEKKQVLLVTSSFPGEGKTTVAANLAETIAKTGSKVLLIGCDLRRPTLHTIFNQAISPGLTEVLVGDNELDAVVHHTGIGSLDFISAGITPPNPAELIGSSQMGRLLKTVRDRYDYILLDAPPLLAVTDAVLLSEYADLMMIVLEVGRVQVRAAQRLREILATMQTPVAGMILNDKSGKGLEYYSYYRDRYGRYGYGQYGYYSSGYYDVDSEDSEKNTLFGRLLSLLRRK